MILDTKLDFQEHLKDKLSKISKTIGLLRKLQKILIRAPLLTMYQSFNRPNLDYGDIIYDKAYNSSFHQNVEEKIQHNSVLGITGAIRGASKEKLYQELGLESLENFVIFIRSLTSNLLNTFSILFLCLADHTLQDKSKMFLLLKRDMIFLKIPFLVLL